MAATLYIDVMNTRIASTCVVAGIAAVMVARGAETNEVADLGIVTVEASALSKYRPENVESGTFTGESPEKLPLVVEP